MNHRLRIVKPSEVLTGAGAALAGLVVGVLELVGVLLCAFVSVLVLPEVATLLLIAICTAAIAIPVVLLLCYGRPNFHLQKLTPTTRSEVQRYMNY